MTSTNRGKLLVSRSVTLYPEADPIYKVLPRDDTVMDVLNETCVAIKSDHVHMTKFDDATNEIYRLIIGHIRELLEPHAVEFAKADEAGTFQRHDELILKTSRTDL